MTALRPGNRVWLVPALMLGAVVGGYELAGADVAWGAAASPSVPPATALHDTVWTRRPVLLVPGWDATERVMAPLRVRLLAAGWPDADVAALTFSNPTGSNRAHAREIAAAVDDLRRRTGTERVDIVAHSMGGLATRLYLEEGGAARVRRVVFVATPQRGTYTAYLAFGRGRPEMIPGSDFLKALNEGPSVPPGVEGLTIRAWLDAHVVPEASATLPGVPDVRICCPTHDGLLANLKAFRVIRSFLETGQATDEDAIR